MMKKLVQLMLVSFLLFSDTVTSQTNEIWGATKDGGHGLGTIYKVNADGTGFLDVAHFSTQSGWAYGAENVMVAGDGVYYGLQRKGGDYDRGVIYSFDPNSNVHTKLYDFVGDAIPFSTDGGEPVGELVQAGNGILYGLTFRGGSYGFGSLFSYNPVTGIYLKLHDFNGTGTGAYPNGILILGSDGLLYGTTQIGGQYDYGTIFSFNTNTNILTRRASFDDVSNGVNPNGEIFEVNGWIFGLATPLPSPVTSQFNPTNPFFPSGNMFAYKMSAQTLHNFAGNAFNYGHLFKGTDGNLYGNCTFNGSSKLFKVDGSHSLSYVFDMGTTYLGFNPEVFSSGKIVSLFGSPDKYLVSYDTVTSQLDTLTSFLVPTSLSKGYSPYIFSKAGNKVIGMTGLGGLNDKGVLYEFDLSNSSFTKLHDFLFYSNGSDPLSGLIRTPNGNLLGVTLYGGRYDDGVVYRVDACSNEIVVVHDFHQGLPGDGYDPIGELTLGPDGKMYGVTQSATGGSFAIYTVDTSTFAFNIPYLVPSGGGNSILPAGLTLAPNGKFYGVSFHGGNYNDGTIFSFDPGTNTYTKHYNFNSGNSNGYRPQFKMVYHPNGLLYGTCYLGGTNNSGTFFSFDPNLNMFNYISSFYTSLGTLPNSNLLVASDNKIYGTTTGGGVNGKGTLFCYNPTNNSFTNLYSFSPATGSNPVGGLVELTPGVFIGHTMLDGNATSSGTVFKFDKNTGVFSVLKYFNGVDGKQPIGQMILVNNNVSLTATSNVICPGSSVTLTATGGSSYTWTPGGATTPSITVNPTTETTYSVSISTGTGCTTLSALTIGVISVSTDQPSVINCTPSSNGQICSNVVGLSNTSNYNYNSSRTYAGLGNQQIGAGLVDGAGNVYYFANYEGSMTFGSTTVTSPTNDQDIAIIKKSPTGSVLWVRSGGIVNSVTDDVIYSLDIDVQGNIYFFAYTGGTFGGYTITGGGYMFGKLDPNGTVQWVKPLQGVNNTLGIREAKINKHTGEIYVVGFFVGTSPSSLYGGPNMNAGSNVYRDAFVGKFNASGVFQWVKLLVSATTDEIQDLVIDNDGNIIVTGYTGGTSVTFGGTPFSTTPTTHSIIIKLKPDGTIIWSRKYYDSNLTGSTSIKDIGIDCENNVYVLGSFTGTIVIDSTQIETPDNFSDLMFFKLNSNGSLQWINTAGAPAKNDLAEYLSISPSCNYILYTMGLQNGATFSNSNQVVSHGYAGSATCFIIYDINGNLMSLNDDFTLPIYSISPAQLSLNEDNMYLAGRIGGNMTVGPYNYTFVSGNGYDCFDIVMQKAIPTNLTYSWSPSSGLSSTTSPSPFYTGVTNGTYTVTVSTGTCSVSNTVNISTAPAANAGSDIGVCAGLSGVLNGASGASVYSWSPSAGLSATNINNPVVTPTSTTTYTLTTTNGNCTSTDQVLVTLNPLPVVSYNQTPNSVCDNGANFTLTAGSPAGGVYSGIGVTGTSFSPSTVGAGTYPIVYTYTNANSCVATDTASITVNVCTSVNEITMGQGINAYPNPSNEKVEITLIGVDPSELNNATFAIYNTVGKLVYSKKMNQMMNEVNVSEFAPGIYFVKIQTTNNTYTKLIIKN